MASEAILDSSNNAACSLVLFAFYQRLMGNQFFSKNIRDSDKSHQTSSQRSNISLIHYSSVGSYQFTDKKRNKNSLNS